MSNAFVVHKQNQSAASRRGGTRTLAVGIPLGERGWDAALSATFSSRDAAPIAPVPLVFQSMVHQQGDGNLVLPCIFFQRRFYARLTWHNFS